MRLTSPGTAFLGLAVLAFLTPRPGHAQSGIQWKRAPIETRADLLGIRYSLAGRPLKDLQDLSDVISPLGDAQADRLLERSKDSALWGGLGGLLGGIGIGWGGFHLLFDDSPARHGADTAILLTGVGVDLLASLFWQDSRASQYNAVARYDRVVRGEDDSLPPAPKDEKDLLPVER